MPDLKLYEYPQAIAEAFARDEALRAIDPEHAAARHEEIDKLEGGRDEKIEHVAMYMLDLAADEEKFRLEAERHTNNRRRVAKEREWYKDYLHKALNAAGKTKVKGKLLTVSLRKNPVSCKVLEQSKVPDEWLLEVVTVSPKKVDMIAHYKKTGEMIAGVEFIDDRTSVVIR